MSLESFFMQIARSKLDAGVFEDIYARAVKAERRKVEAEPALSRDKQVTNKVAAANVGAHLNGVVPPHVSPHVADRMEERFALAATPSDLGELSQLVKQRGPNVKLVKQEMRLIATYEVSWRGKRFMVIFDQSRGHLVTAHGLSKRKPKRKTLTGVPRRQQNEILEMLDETREGGMDA